MDNLDLQECVSSSCGCSECIYWTDEASYKPWIKEN